MSKKIHSQDKALQRYNQEFSFKDLDNIKTKILADNCILVESAREQRYFYYVIYKNIPVKVLFDWHVFKVITLYPLCVEEYNNLSKIKSIN